MFSSFLQQFDFNRPFQTDVVRKYISTYYSMVTDFGRFFCRYQCYTRVETPSYFFVHICKENREMCFSSNLYVSRKT